MAKIALPHNFVPRKYQLPVLRALDGGAKRAVAVWHRRSGKEKTFVNYTAAASADRIGTYFYFFPTFAQGKKAVWDGRDKNGFPFMGHFPAQYVKRKNETEMKMEFINGSAFQVIGTDNIDSIMSSNPIGCVFAEYSLQDPRAWDYVRPILKENGGWAIFDFTPRGKNHGFHMYEMAKKLQADGDPNWFAERLTINDTGVFTDADMDAERREGMSEDMIQQEYYCSFEGVQQGSIFGSQMELAEKEKRICSVPWQQEVGVDTWWDIGTGDAASIWFTQNIGREVHVIDYYTNSGVGMDHYAAVVKRKPYVYNSHNGPHDLESRSFAANGKSTLAVAAGLGIYFRVVPKLDKTSQINAGRAFMGRCYFDRVKTDAGRLALTSYHYTWDSKRKCFNASPYHDWSSNGSDAFMQLAVGHKLSPPKRVNEGRGHSRMASQESPTSWLGT